MKNQTTPRIAKKAPVILLLTMILGASAWGATEKVVYNFFGVTGTTPRGNLIADGKGNFYGTTDSGGTYDAGAVFELSPDGHGGYSETVLHNFAGEPSDGEGPLAALVFDKSGNLYGTTFSGGQNQTGVVFELSPNGNGSWTESLLWQFGDEFRSNDGTYPSSSLVFDASGNLYGTTEDQANFGNPLPGTVFELSPQSNGTWTESILHTFSGGPTDGAIPFGGLTLHNGVLYGTTNQGGSTSSGTVYQFTHSANGWTETVLYSFAGGTTDGCGPYFEKLVFDDAGNIFGTTANCGTDDDGTIFELRPSGTNWTESLIHSFGGQSSGDGSNPSAGVMIKGKYLWGSTQTGGAAGTGTVFLFTNSNQGWTESEIYSFGAQGVGDGVTPDGVPILGANGHLYGTTAFGGSADLGTVYEVGY